MPPDLLPAAQALFAHVDHPLNLDAVLMAGYVLGRLPLRKAFGGHSYAVAILFFLGTMTVQVTMSAVWGLQGASLITEIGPYFWTPIWACFALGLGMGMRHARGGRW